MDTHKETHTHTHGFSKTTHTNGYTQGDTHTRIQ